MNKVIMLGRIQEAPVIKTFDFGSMANFVLVTADRWKDKNTGEMHEKTEKHRIVASDPMHLKTLENSASGDQIFLEGKIQTRKYKDNRGEEKYITEVVIPKAIGTLMLIDRNMNEVEIQQRKPAPKRAYSNMGRPMIDDEIPF